LDHYCPAGTGYPIHCGHGKYTLLKGRWASTQCLNCPAGKYCQATQLTTNILSNPSLVHNPLAIVTKAIGVLKAPMIQDQAHLSVKLVIIVPLVHQVPPNVLLEHINQESNKRNVSIVLLDSIVN
jgi:hypothetical protein